ncbi:MAG: sigma-70 family RNA polymerase sigma factor [Proteobacteria bacterium]|nr:sigma-70 family RNA polymerase sigma factor [Pseudomonadota bacterium]
MALTLEEENLLEGCRKGGEQAWLALYRAYGRDVGVFLKSMVPHSSEIDDLVQKVFLEFLTSLDRFRGDASIRTWLHRIALRVAQHNARSNRRRARFVRAYAETLRDDARSPEGQALARVQLTQVQSVLLDLRTPFREVWILRELVGLSVAETAAVLETQPATVRTRHLRARQRVLAVLQRLDGANLELARRRSIPSAVRMKGTATS